MPALPGSGVYRRLPGAGAHMRTSCTPSPPETCQTAAKILRSANPLAAICGRVCPQEAQCELKCHMTKRFGPVAIGHLERFVSDWEMEQPRSEEDCKTLA